MYVCKKWFLVVFWVVGVYLYFVQGLGFVHMICFCLLVMYVCEKMVSCCVLGCWCQSLLRLGFKVCSYDLLLLAGYACMRKNGFLLCSGLLVSIFHPPMSFFYLENCVFQNYTQRTTQLNWANHLVFLAWRPMCVSQNYTQQTTQVTRANHLVIPSRRPVCVFQNYTQRTTQLNWANYLVLPPLRPVCVFQNYTQRTTQATRAKHLVFPPRRPVCVPKLYPANHLAELG